MSRDRERLARVFGIEPMQPAAAAIALGSTSTIALVAPVLWPINGVAVAGFVTVRILEDRQLAAGLREVQAWGFPVEGYRAWLLADNPAFDLELRREVATELIADATAAVDASIAVERRAERVVRIHLPRVELPTAPHRQPVTVGDRRMLHALARRVLAPLHADVGVVTMRMGDRDRLAALVPTAPRDAAGGDAFRDQAVAAPPELQSLVRAGSALARPPDDARAIRHRTDRLLFATKQHPTSARALTGSVSAGAFVGLFGGPIGFLIGTAVGTAIAFAMRQRDRYALESELGVLSAFPFRFEGYEDWLLSGRPIMDIELDAGFPERAWLSDRVYQALQHIPEVTWLGDQLIRIETRPAHHLAGQGIPAFWGGDPRELMTLGHEVLMPLHEKVGIVVVRMGGYLDRRA